MSQKFVASMGSKVDDARHNETSAILYGPDGWANVGAILEMSCQCLRYQQQGREVMLWAGVVGDRQTCLTSQGSRRS